MHSVVAMHWRLLSAARPAGNASLLVLVVVLVCLQGVVTRHSPAESACGSQQQRHHRAQLQDLAQCWALQQPQACAQASTLLQVAACACTACCRGDAAGSAAWRLRCHIRLQCRCRGFRDRRLLLPRSGITNLTRPVSHKHTMHADSGDIHRHSPQHKRLGTVAAHTSMPPHTARVQFRALHDGLTMGRCKCTQK